MYPPAHTHVCTCIRTYVLYVLWLLAPVKGLQLLAVQLSIRPVQKRSRDHAHEFEKKRCESRRAGSALHRRAVFFVFSSQRAVPEKARKWSFRLAPPSRTYMRATSAGRIGRAASSRVFIKCAGHGRRMGVPERGYRIVSDRRAVLHRSLQSAP